MNPVFWILVIIVAIAIWFLLCFIFKPVGKFFYRIFKDVKDTVEEEEQVDETEEDIER